MIKVKSVIKDFIPPILLKTLNKIRGKILIKASTKYLDSTKQELGLYWENDFANVLETWAEDNAWFEIQLLLVNTKGKILDIACGTGRVIEILKKFDYLEVYGLDISDFLINRAIEKGIKETRLKICDATNTGFSDNYFMYSYSIGSLEHFTEGGIIDFLKECSRYSKFGSFHMIPVSRNGKDNGWIRTSQTYFNNSEEWWLNKFKKYFSKVYIVKSKWEDSISFGRWFLCYKF